MIADFRVVLDACVLTNFAVANVFLTFAECAANFPQRTGQSKVSTRAIH
jgi:hypothetical protein